MAISDGQDSVVKILRKAGKGTNALHWAASVDISEDAIAALAAAGVDPNAKETELGTTPLHWAVVFGNPDVIGALVAVGADLNSRNDRDHTPLDMAISMDRDDVAAALRAAGAE